MQLAYASPSLRDDLYYVGKDRTNGFATLQLALLEASRRQVTGLANTSLPIYQNGVEVALKRF